VPKLVSAFPRGDMPPCCPPLAYKAVINHSTQKAPLTLLRIWSAETCFRFSPRRHAAVLPTTGLQSCDKSQHSKSAAGALENMECGNLFPLSSAASCRNRPIKTPPEMNQMYSLHLQKLTQNVDAMKKPWELLN